MGLWRRLTERPGCARLQAEGAAEPAVSARLAATAGRATGEVPLAPGPPEGRVLEADEGSAYCAWRSTREMRPGVRAAPARDGAPATPAYGDAGPERAEDSPGVGVVRIGAVRLGDGGGLPNVPAVEPEGAPARPLRSADAPNVLDVGIAPARDRPTTRARRGWRGGGRGRRRRERREPRRATVPKRHFEIANVVVAMMTRVA